MVGLVEDTRFGVEGEPAADSPPLSALGFAFQLILHSSVEVIYRNIMFNYI